jgi:hypothetical protein
VLWPRREPFLKKGDTYPNAVLVSLQSIYQLWRQGERNCGWCAISVESSACIASDIHSTLPALHSITDPFPLVFLRYGLLLITLLPNYNVSCLLKARAVKQADATIANEWLYRRPLLGNSSVAVTWWPQKTPTQQCKSCWKWCFLSGPCRVYIMRTSHYERENTIASRLEAGWNTSTVALWGVGGDEKGTQCLGV